MPSPRKKRRCYAMRRNPNGMGDVRCKRLAEHGRGGLCHSCATRVQKGGDAHRTFLPYGRIKHRKMLEALERDAGKK